MVTDYATLEVRSDVLGQIRKALYLVGAEHGEWSPTAKRAWDRAVSNVEKILWPEGNPPAPIFE
jgi:hypothetical protein